MARTPQDTKQGSILRFVSVGSEGAAGQHATGASTQGLVLLHAAVCLEALYDGGKASWHAQVKHDNEALVPIHE